jgi:DNA-binding response OmpR family regulator
MKFGALLRRAKITNSHRLEVGDVLLDAGERSCIVKGEEVNLTTREFNILYKLLSYPKKTFTRAQLMDEFWGMETDASLRAVDVYITKLRSKLIDCDGFKISTVRGLGYKAVLK